VPAGSLGDLQHAAADSQGPARRAWQAQRANALAAEQGLAERVRFQVADALQQPFADASFDLVWSMESGEHMCAAGCPTGRMLTAATCWRPRAAYGRGCWVTSSHTRRWLPHSFTAVHAKAAVRAMVLHVSSFVSNCVARRPDKERFVGELARVCEPGGRIIIVTWCHRCAGQLRGAASDAPQHEQVKQGACLRACVVWYSTQLGWHASKTAHPRGCRITHRAHGTSWCSRAALRARNLRPGEAGLTADEQALLDRICEAYYLPAWCSEDDYRRICSAQGLQARPG